MFNCCGSLKIEATVKREFVICGLTIVGLCQLCNCKRGMCQNFNLFFGKGFVKINVDVDVSCLIVYARICGSNLTFFLGNEAENNVVIEMQQ